MRTQTYVDFAVVGTVIGLIGYALHKGEDLVVSIKGEELSFEPYQTFRALTTDQLYKACLKVSSRVTPEIVSKILVQTRIMDINPVLVCAQIRQESNFDPKAVSSANAIGLLQVIPLPACAGMAQVCLDFPNDVRGYCTGTPSTLRNNLFDPETNLKFGIRYLQWCMRYQKSVTKALRFYVGGKLSFVIVNKAYGQSLDYVRRIQGFYDTINKALA